MGLSPSAHARCQGVGDIWTFNMDHAYCEAICRGYRKGFLTPMQYAHMSSASNLTDIKLNLEETDYAKFLQDYDKGGRITPKVIKLAAIQKFTDEFQYMRSQACGDLAIFLDYISYEYMIDNIIMILQHTLTDPDGDVSEVLERLHPLGSLGTSIERNIASFEPSKKGIENLFLTVLVATPVGHYFTSFLQTLQQADAATVSGDEVGNLLDEASFMMLENFVFKAYLEDFHELTLKLGGDSTMFCSHILKRRADKRTINICVNSFSTGLGLDENKRKTDRQQLFPTCGYLFPESYGLLEDVSTAAGLAEVLQPHCDYADLWKAWVPEGEDDEVGGLDDGFYRMEVEELEDCFLGQSHFAIFYAFVKLKEQECRNLEWISECVLQGRKDQIDKIVKIFDSDRVTRGWAKQATN